MVKILLKITVFTALLTWLNWVGAATMGGINVLSALGHPLKAEVSLGDIAKKDKASIEAKLATVAEFKSAGIEYPYSLPKLIFEVETRSSGNVVLKISSTQPVNDPFVTLLVDLTWSSGKMLREFTFLLDPAGFTPEQPKAPEVQPVEPLLPVEEPITMKSVPLPDEVPVVAPVAASVEPVAADVAPAESAAVTQQGSTEAAAAVAATQGDQPVSGMVSPAEEVRMEPIRAEQQGAESAEKIEAKSDVVAAEKGSVSADTTILIEKGDTLGKIAKELKPVDVSLERMLVALYRANVNQFDGKNMNRIRAGKIIRMPENEEIEKITQKAAVREIRAQVADWQEYRQKLAASAAVAPDVLQKQAAATGKISTAVAEKAPVIKESAKEVLKLSKGETVGDKTVVAANTKEEKAVAKADDAAAKKKQEQEEKARLEKLEKMNQDAAKLVELKSKPADQPKPVEPAKPVTAEKPAAEVKKPAPIPPPPAQQPPVEAETDYVAMVTDFVSSLFQDETTLYIIGAIVVLIAGGAGFYFYRKNKGPSVQKKTKKNDEVGSATGSWRTPVAPSPDTGDFTQAFQSPVAQAAPMTVAAATDDVDPISEADLFLNFGRDVQAEEILKDALKKTPDNNQVKLKLLSIYSSRKDIKSFTKYANEVKDSGDTSAWERAAVMGREIDPSNPNYGGVKGEARQQREPAKAEVDFDLGLGTAGAPPISAAAAKDFKMDFDLSGAQAPAVSKDVDIEVDFAKTMVSSSPLSTADVDATSILSREMVKAAENASPMDFDVSGILPGDVKSFARSNSMDMDISSSSGITETGTMDFDVSGSIPSLSTGSASGGGMDFDVSGSLPSASSGAGAGGMDFDVSGSIPSVSGANGLGSMDLDISSAPAGGDFNPMETAIDVTSAIPSVNFSDMSFDIPSSDNAGPADTEKAKEPAADTGLSFSIDFPTDMGGAGSAPAEAPAKQAAMGGFDLGEINFNLDGGSAAPSTDGKDEQWHEVATKLDLAKAYQEMGDADGAREILEEVVREGDQTQKDSAEKLLQQIAA